MNEARASVTTSGAVLELESDDLIALWKRAQDGAEGTEAQLCGVIDAVVRNELRYRGTRAEDLDDLVQEATISVLRYMRGGGTIDSNLRGFLKGRAWGVLSGLRRKYRSRAFERSADMLDDKPTLPPPSPEREAHRAELARAFGKCLAKLGKTLRTTFEDHYQRGTSTREIATRSGIAQDTVHVRLYRARVQIRECLEKHGFDAGDVP